MLRSAFVPLRSRPGSINAKTTMILERHAEQGGWWSSGTNLAQAVAPRILPSLRDPQFAARRHISFYFQPYASQAFRDGSIAHLPWLQGNARSVDQRMWSTWVEVNPKPAARLKIVTGDLIESRHNKEACEPRQLFRRALLPM